MDDLDGTRRRYQLVRRALPAVRARTTWRCRATSSAISSSDIGVPPGRVAQIYNGVDTARFRRAAGGARADSPAARSPTRRCSSSAPSAACSRSRIRCCWRAPSCARSSARRRCAPRLRLVMVGDGPLRAEAAGGARAARRARRAGLARRRARRRAGRHARPRLLRAAVAGRGHLQHHSRSDGDAGCRSSPRASAATPSYRGGPLTGGLVPRGRRRGAGRGAARAGARPAPRRARSARAGRARRRAALQPGRDGRRATSVCIDACSPGPATRGPRRSQRQPNRPTEAEGHVRHHRHLRHRAARATIAARALRAHERVAAPPRPRRGRPAPRARRRPRPPAAVDHRPRHRPAAAVQRGRLGRASSSTARSTTTRS